MDITRRLLGQAAIVENANVVGVDLNAIARRLIIFDTYILKSIRLKEFPFLASQLGFEGTMELLESVAFGVECEAVSTGQTGQTGILESRAIKGVLPLLSYGFSGINIANREKYVHDCLQPLHDLSGLTHKQITKLKRTLVDKMTRLPNGFAGKLAVQVRSDILGKPHLVRRSVEIAIRSILNRDPGKFEISVQPIDSEDLRVETDLPRHLGIDLQTAHEVIQRGLLGLAGLAQRLLEMEAHSALNGFIDDDLPLVYEHLDFLARNISPGSKEKQFRRVLTIAGIPDFVEPGSGRALNVGRLLEVRESDECREFRQWLSTIESASDAEVKERLCGLRHKLGNAIQTYPGKAVRLLTTTGIGSLPVIGPVAGFAVGMIDTFLLDRLLPKSGILSFLSHLYPSVFEDKRCN